MRGTQAVGAHSEPSDRELPFPSPSANLVGIRKGTSAVCEPSALAGGFFITAPFSGILEKQMQPTFLRNFYTNPAHLNANFMRKRLASIMYAQSATTDPAFHDKGACTVKVYYFSPETGIFQGDDYLDEHQLDVTEGVTRIAPPEYARGEVPIFEAVTQRWLVVKVSGRSFTSPEEQP
jgi:hypothetical protein